MYSFPIAFVPFQLHEQILSPIALPALTPQKQKKRIPSAGEKPEGEKRQEKKKKRRMPAPLLSVLTAVRAKAKEQRKEMPTRSAAPNPDAKPIAAKAPPPRMQRPTPLRPPGSSGSMPLASRSALMQQLPSPLTHSALHITPK
jgi:hypothetical protein